MFHFNRSQSEIKSLGLGSVENGLEPYNQNPVHDLIMQEVAGFIPEQWTEPQPLGDVGNADCTLLGSKLTEFLAYTLNIDECDGTDIVWARKGSITKRFRVAWRSLCSDDGYEYSTMVCFLEEGVEDPTPKVFLFSEGELKATDLLPQTP